jgi:hypothetical protein
MSISDEVAFDSRTHLQEHCGRCAQGIARRDDGTLGLCIACNGSGRVTRHTHDPRSSIDYEPAPDTAPRFVARIAALAERHPNDADLGAAVRALLGGERCSSR